MNAACGSSECFRCEDGLLVRFTHEMKWGESAFVEHSRNGIGQMVEKADSIKRSKNNASAVDS